MLPDNAPRGYVSGGGLVPVPDPSRLTTEQLRTELGNLRELLEEKTVNAELKTEQLKAVTNEIFERIAVQFAERDKRTEALTVASTTAISAALQAAKEAVGAQNTSNSIAISKSEASTTESIRQLQILFDTTMSGLKDQMTDIRSRIDRAEGAAKGVGVVWGFAVGVIGAIFGLVGIITFALRFVR